MKWIEVRVGTDSRFGSLDKQKSFGSSTSNALCFLHDRVPSVSGIFSSEDRGLFYRCLESGAEYELSRSSWVDLSYGSIRLIDFNEFWDQHSSAIIKEYRQAEGGKQKNIIHSQWFLEPQWPNEVLYKLQEVEREIEMLSPIEHLLAGEEITDILVEDFNRIFVEKAGRLERVALRFSDPQTYQIYIEKLLHQANQTLDESKPFANFLLPGGARVHLAGGSITGGSFYLSIRRPSSKVWDLADLSQKGMFSNALRFTIQSLLKQKLNILISGATGSGKTSLLRSLLMEITASERLIIMEDVPELRIGRSNAAYLNTRQEVGSDLPEIGLRELIRQSLRMRPDRLVLGEVRGPEALDLLLAMNTGHQGCLGTLHANNARDALWRLQCLIRLGSGEIQESTAQELIHRNIHVIIHCQKDSQGVRQIKEIAYMRGIESGCYLLEYHSEDAPSCEAQRFCA